MEKLICNNCKHEITHFERTLLGVASEYWYIEDGKAKYDYEDFDAHEQLNLYCNECLEPLDAEITRKLEYMMFGRM